MSFKNKKSRDGLKTPVLFIMFNRPEDVANGLAILREVRPERLYVVSDGPRPHVEGEEKLVRECRSMVENIDWPCEVKRNYARHNLNCGIRTASGMHWVFRHESKAIIVEDDLRPDPSFFLFCEQMLSKYESREEVMLISGRNNLGQFGNTDSYFFSRTVNPWGWASWSRAWKHFRFPYKYWTEKNRLLYQEILLDEDQARFHDYNERNCQGRLLDTWDIQWIYSVYRHRGFSIIPGVNLVENRGFNPRGTHTHNDFDIRAELPASSLSFPLSHPAEVKYDTQGHQFDRWNFLLEQLAGFKNPLILAAIYKIWQAGSPSDPVLQERYKDVIPYLYPLKNRAESRKILLHVLPHLPQNAFLENLLKYFL